MRIPQKSNIVLKCKSLFQKPAKPEEKEEDLKNFEDKEPLDKTQNDEIEVGIPPELSKEHRHVVVASWEHVQKGIAEASFKRLIQNNPFNLLAKGQKFHF